MVSRDLNAIFCEHELPCTLLTIYVHELLSKTQYSVELCFK